MSILITGAQGFLGQATRRLALAQGLNVSAAARTNEDGCIALDITDLKGLLALLDRTSPDIVINCAAMVSFNDGTLADQYSINSLVPATLAAWCADNDRHLVHVSSAAVAGVKCQEVTATTPSAPDTDYGTAKHLAEAMIKASAAAHACIRFGGIFGHPGPAHLGLNRAIANAKQGQRPRVIGTGSARRNYMHVEDAARILLHCALNRITGTLAAGGRDTMTISNIMSTLCDHFIAGASPEYVDGPEAADQLVVTTAGLPEGGSYYDGLVRCQ